MNCGHALYRSAELKYITLRGVSNICQCCLSFRMDLGSMLILYVAENYMRRSMPLLYLSIGCEL